MFSSILKTMFDDVLLPLGLTAAGAAVPFFGMLLSIPIIGPAIKAGIKHLLDKLLDNGIIEINVSIIDKLSNEAKEKYAAEVAIIREAQSQPALTPEQEAEYAKRLQELVKNRPGVVNG